VSGFRICVCLLLLLPVSIYGQSSPPSSLPPCPSDNSVIWRNCFGTYVFSDGERYVGEWSDGKRSGEGINTLPNGEKYVGEWSDGERSGHGTNTFFNGEKYVGEWKNDKRSGHGTHTSPNGAKYVGEWKNDKRNGQGIEYDLVGAVKASGMWRDDQLSQSFTIDTRRLSSSASRGEEAKDPLNREPNKKTSLEIVTDCLAKGFKPGSERFTRCIAEG